MTNTWIKRLTTAGTLLAIATVGVVKTNEGENTDTKGNHIAYYDSAGIATICYGETKGVKIGMVKTKSECDAQLQKSIAEHAKVFDGVPQETPDVVALGAIDMAYNVGIYGFNASSVKKAIIAGDYSQAGKAVLQWKYITRNGKKYDCSVKGNKVCWGLWQRRLWQSKAIGNQFKSPQEALNELNNIYR